MFALNTNGSGFANLYSFTVVEPDASNTPTNSDGNLPPNGVIMSGNTLYGTTSGGGIWGQGTLFSLSLGSVSPPPPQLTMVLSVPYVILTWPSNVTGLSLQSTTNLGSSAFWTTNLPAPAIVNGQYCVTNSITGTQQFFRLSQ